jgi:hypothetical protein
VAQCISVAAPTKIRLRGQAAVPFRLSMSMAIGSSVGAVSPAVVSEAASSGNQVQGEAAVSILKKAMENDANIAQQLIASATGVGQKLDVTG